MLAFLSGEPFTTGSQQYSFRPASDSDSSNRIILEVEIQGRKTYAMLDTGAPYLICNPKIAGELGLSPQTALMSAQLSIRGISISGWLYRLDLTLPAEQGDALLIETTAFVPDANENDWPGLPSVIGLQGCLERIRFAIDTSDETFHFGSQSE